MRIFRKIAVFLQALALIAAPFAGAHADEHGLNTSGLHAHSGHDAAANADEQSAGQSDAEIPVGGLFGIDLILAGVDLSPGDEGRAAVYCCETGTGLCSPPAVTVAESVGAFGISKKNFRSAFAGSFSGTLLADIFHPPRLTA